MEVDETDIRRYWDARAREHPYYFVDLRRSYRNRDAEGFWLWGEKDLDQLLGALEVQIGPRDAVVDIGCGVGRLTRAIASRAARAYGIDISPEMIERARGHPTDLANIEWIVGDGVSLRPIQDAAVDACVSLVVFQHIPDPAVTLGYIREMARVLRPGGWAAFQVSNDPAVHRRIGGLRGLKRLAGAVVGLAPRGTSDPAWIGSVTDLREVRELATDCGLSIERLVGAGTQYCGILLRRLRTLPPEVPQRPAPLAERSANSGGS
jgi:SAM-dependent methyltransferase